MAHVDKKMIVVVLVACLVVVVVISAVQHMDGSEDAADLEGDQYTFLDAKGVKHTVNVPLTNVSVVHKYIPVFMKILGVEEEVAGLDSTHGITFKDYFPNSYSIGTFSEPDGPTMIKNGSKVILTPVTMGLSNSNALSALGIEVIYLDLTDPYVIGENLEILVNLFGATEEVRANQERYMEFFTECGEFVDSFDFDDTEDKNFALYMSSSGFMQTHASAAVKVIEEVSGKSYTNITDPNTKDTVYFNPNSADLVDFDGEHGLDYVFLYSLDTPEKNYDKFLAFGGDINLKDLSCIKNKQVYSISTDCVNGALSCISQILYAEAYGADVGNKAAEMISAFNEEFGLHYSIDDLLVSVA